MEVDSASKASNGELTTLNDRLDSLWTEYLDHLDTYTKAQAAIQQSLSAGFFSLARANSRAPAGRRYGQDWYDDRMKATRRVLLRGADGMVDVEGNYKQKVVHITTAKSQTVARDGEKSTSTDIEEQPTQQPSPPATPEAEPREKSDTTAGDSKQCDKNAATALTDPLRWFGILIPPEMRRAQNAFSAILDEASIDGLEASGQDIMKDGPVVSAVSAAERMRELEMEIRKLRKSVKKLERRITEAES